jgi:hypothetical protein
MSPDHHEEYQDEQSEPRATVGMGENPHMCNYQAGIDLDNLWMTNKPFQNFIAEFNKLAMIRSQKRQIH